MAAFGKVFGIRRANRLGVKHKHPCRGGTTRVPNGYFIFNNKYSVVSLGIPRQKAGYIIQVVQKKVKKHPIDLAH